MSVATRRRRAAGGDVPPAPPPLTIRTRLVFIDDGFLTAIDARLGRLNTKRALEGQPPVSWNNFLVYGLAKNGLDAFDAAYQAFEASQQLVTPATTAEVQTVEGTRRG